MFGVYISKPIKIERVNEAYYKAAKPEKKSEYQAGDLIRIN